jgi:hypothetical protein
VKADSGTSKVLLRSGPLAATIEKRGPHADTHASTDFALGQIVSGIRLFKEHCQPQSNLLVIQESFAISPIITLSIYSLSHAPDFQLGKHIGVGKSVLPALYHILIFCKSWLLYNNRNFD